MIKITIYVIAAIAFCLWIADAKITFSPFSFSLPKWKELVGIILIVAGLSFIRLQEEQNGYRKGYDDGIDFAIDKLKNIIEQSKTKENAQSL